MAAQVQGERLLLIERDIERAIAAFYHALDSSDFEHLSNAMAPDGVWHRQGKELRGPGMVREAMKVREPGARTRHLVTNLLIDQATETTAAVRFYMIAFRTDGDPGRPKPDKIELPRALSLYTVRLVRAGDKWLFTEIKGDTTFKS